MSPALNASIACIASLGAYSLALVFSMKALQKNTHANSAMRTTVLLMFFLLFLILFLGLLFLFPEHSLVVILFFLGYNLLKIAAGVWFAYRKH